MIGIERFLAIAGNGYSRLLRNLASDEAETARRIAEPGEPHAKARRRLRDINDEVSRRTELAMLYGSLPPKNT